MSDIVDLIDSSSTSDENSISMRNDDDFDENNETPYQTLIRLHSSYSDYNDRKNAVKYLLDALRSVNELEQLYEVLSCTKKLADDIMTQVQIDCLEKMIPIIEYLVENVENADILVREYLFQSILQTIAHGNNRIRKCSQSTLIRLFELEQLKMDQIENEIVPCLCQLDRACDDFKNESIVLMTRLTTFLPSDLILKSFLPTIIDQSSSIAFQTRKTCATALGDLCSYLPRSSVDQSIIPCLSNLCSDPFWGVRKSCAEVIHPLAQVCSAESRWNILSPCLIQLLQDQSRWVKTAALRVLGYFISTFAQTNSQRNENHFSNEEQISSSNSISSNETNSQFNEFFFWKKFDFPSIDFPIESNGEQISSSKEESPLEKSKKYARDDVRRIVPIELLDCYRNLVDQSYSSGVETDIVHQGAHTFPGVALTLTNEHWHLIKDIHRKFSEDLQWKVRRTLAYSLHVLAEILTKEQVEEDLCPVFDSFIRDVDEVKIGIVSHLSQFIEVLPNSTRRFYLDKLTFLTTVDNQRNWRFRSECANQLNELTNLFDSTDIGDYIHPLVFAMAIDKVCDVRQSALKALCGCYCKYSSQGNERLMEIFLEDANRIFAQSFDCKFRQCFLQLSRMIFQRNFHSIDKFTERFFHQIFSFTKDPVVNVRLTLGHFLYEDFFSKEEIFLQLSHQWKVQLKQTMELLKSDRDRDVRFAVGNVFPLQKDRIDLEENLCNQLDSSLKINVDDEN